MLLLVASFDAGPGTNVLLSYGVSSAVFILSSGRWIFTWVDQVESASKANRQESALADDVTIQCVATARAESSDQTVIFPLKHAQPA